MANCDIPELRIARGESVFLYGPSGTGKTTLLGLLAGILEASAGEVSVLGQNFSGMTSVARDAFRGQHIGYVFQMFNLIPYLTARDNILLPLRLRGGHNRKIDQAALEELTRGLNIHPYLNRKANELSVDHQQRVAAARAPNGCGLVARARG